MDSRLRGNDWVLLYRYYEAFAGMTGFFSIVIPGLRSRTRYPLPLEKVG